MIVGIDLGTTNSLISVFRDGKPELLPNALGRLLTPSVVGLDSKGELVVGEAARDQLITQPERTAARFKRLMGTKQVTQLGRQKFSPEELSALVLRSLVADAEAHLGEKVTEAIISVPAYFNEPQRKATQVAAKLAGLSVRRLINEPTAAALAYGLNDREGESTFLVFDLGGGTFDVSILELFDGIMEVRASAGDAFLGGEDFTDSLAALIAERLKLGEPKKIAPSKWAVLRRQADQMKRGLTEHPILETELTFDGQSHELKLEREDLAEAAKPLLARLRRPLERAMGDAGLRTAQLDRIVLVGGASRMSSVKALVTKLFGRFPEFDIDPDHVVALGAAVQAGLADRDEALEDIVMTDVCPFTLGVDSSERISATEYRHDVFVPIIERNSVVPISREHTFHTMADKQTQIDFSVYQGESAKASENVFLDKLVVPVPPAKAGEESVAMRFTYDMSGLLEAEATVLSTKVKRNLVITSDGAALGDEEIKAKLKSLAKLKEHPRDDAANVALIARIKRLYEMKLGEERQYVNSLLGQIEAVIARQDKHEIDKVREEIAEQLDRLESDRIF